MNATNYVCSIPVSYRCHFDEIFHFSLIRGYFRLHLTPKSPKIKDICYRVPNGHSCVQITQSDTSDSTFLIIKRQHARDEITYRLTRPMRNLTVNVVV